MALATVPGGVWAVPAYQVGSTGSLAFSNLTIDASGEKVAFILDAPKSGTLDTFEFRVTIVSNNPDNGLRISFQDIDANGNPDGTQDQFCDIAGPFSSNTWITPGLITSDGTNTGTKRTVTAGQRLAVVIEFVSFVAGDNINIAGLSFASGVGSMVDTQCYVDQFASAAWTKITSSLIVGALKYATDGYVSFFDQAYPLHTLNTRTYNSGSTPDEIALRFQIPFSGACDGFWVRGDFDGDTDIVLYDSDGTTVLASYTIDASARETTAGANYQGHWAPVTLLANTTYRLSVKPTTGTNIVLYTNTTNSAGLMAAAPGGAEWYRSERTDAGAWTETTSERPFAGLHFGSLDDGTGDGGGSPDPGSPGDSGSVETGFATVG